MEEATEKPGAAAPTASTREEGGRAGKGRVLTASRMRGGDDKQPTTRWKRQAGCVETKWPRLVCWVAHPAVVAGLHGAQVERKSTADWAELCR